MGRHRLASRRRDVVPVQRASEQRGGRHRGVWITDARTEVEHLVGDESVASHRHAGRYLALCGNHVLAASLTAPERSRCEPCRAVVVLARGVSERRG